MKNFYHILGLSLEPAPEQQLIEAAYRALVKLYHPDVYKGDKKSLKRKISEINEAYDTLSDNKKREDRRRKAKRAKGEKRREKKIHIPYFVQTPPPPPP